MGEERHAGDSVGLLRGGSNQGAQGSISRLTGELSGETWRQAPSWVAARGDNQGAQGSISRADRKQRLSFT